MSPCSNACSPGRGEPGEVLGDGCPQLESRVGSAVHELVEVVRRAEVDERPARRDREDRHRAGAARRREPRPVHRVDGQIERRSVARAERLAGVQHGRAVLLALAGHDADVGRRTGERTT